MDRKPLGLRIIRSLAGRDESRHSLFAPREPSGPSICPHCWEVNRRSYRLCGRCGADMTLLLQESGGLRRTAPVQSPVPVRGRRLSRIQRLIVAAFAALIALSYVAGALGFGLPPAPVAVEE